MSEGFIDPILINKMSHALATNYGMYRRGIASEGSFDPRRAIYDECGFPEDTWINPERMRDLYNRDPIAARVVEIWPKECWQVTPEVYESEDPKTQTPFEQAWDNLGKSLVSEPGYHEQEKGSAIWEYLLRADIMCGIGRYAVMLLGVDDGEPLDTPLLPSSALIQAGKRTGPLELKFLRVFPESLAKINTREDNKKSPRYGQPKEYALSQDTVAESGATTSGQQVENVHWTRVIHFVDNIQTSEIFGEYRLKPVLNDILSCQKPSWGSGEMYWKGAAPKISFETNPQLGGDVNIDTDDFKDQVEQTINGLQQYWVLRGLTAKPIAPQAVDPSPFIDAPIRRICIKLGVPVPVFMGYEVGENAGTMNSEEWNDRVQQSQNGHRSPRVIAPLVNRLINLGILPTPKGYKIYWPTITNKSEKENAQVGAIRTAALANYTRSDIRKYIGPVQFLTEFLGMEEERASILIKSGLDTGLQSDAASDTSVKADTTGSTGGGAGNPRIATGGSSGLAGTETEF